MSCAVPVSKPNILFDLGDTRMVSHVFEVKPGEVWAIQAQGLMDGDEITVETVTGCGAGDLFECYTGMSCGCPTVLSCSTQRVIIPFTGRYRLVITTGAPGDFRITGYPTSDVGYTGDNAMACGCNKPTAGELADQIAASPSAVAGLCAALSPCIRPTNVSSVDFSTLTTTQIMQLLSLYDFDTLTTQQIEDIVNQLDFSVLSPTQISELCTALAGCIQTQFANAQNITDLLTAIDASAALKALFCAIVAQCSAAVADATTTNKGIVELATGPETVAGTDATLAVTPASLAALFAAAPASVPAATNDVAIPQTHYGTNANYLGEPVRWISLPGGGRLPVY